MPQQTELTAARGEGTAAPSSGRRRRRRGPVILLTTLAVVGAAGWLGARELQSALVGPHCSVTAAGKTETFAPDQAANAAIITAVSIKRDLPPRAATIALTTAYQESKIRNITYGDRDSLGLFQQRPSQGWGTEEEVLDPVYSSNAFYDALVKLDGYEDADITEIAQKVQRSAYPDHYRDHEGQGRALASTLTGHSPAGLTCVLDPSDGAVGPERVAADLGEQMGLPGARPTATGVTIEAPDQRTAWAVAHWAVASAAQYGVVEVSVGERVWEREAGERGWSQGSESQRVSIVLG